MSPVESVVRETNLRQNSVRWSLVPRNIIVVYNPSPHSNRPLAFLRNPDVLRNFSQITAEHLNFVFDYRINLLAFLRPDSCLNCGRDVSHEVGFHWFADQGLSPATMYGTNGR